MAFIEDIGDEFENRIQNYSQFKIGKTGRDLRARFEQEYEGKYKFKEELAHSSKKNLANELEKYLIERFINNPSCDNEMIGGGEMMDSTLYRVYVVYNI